MGRLAKTSPSYLYLAAKASGGRTVGMARAAGPRQLADQLRRERMVPLRSWEMPDWATVDAAGLSLKDQCELNTQLAQLLTRGVPLVEALEVAASAVGQANRGTITRMRDMVSSGSSFADACAATGVFDKVSVAVYRAAERTGDLGGAAKQLAGTARRTLQIQGKAGTIMLYPTVVAIIGSVVVLAVLTLIVPQIAKALDGSGIELPLFSRFVIGSGIVLRDYFFWFLLGFLGLVTLAVFMRSVLASWIAKLSRVMPYLRDVVLAQESTRFFTVMASMSRSGVVLADALGVAVNAISHPLLKKQLITMQTKLIEGGVLRQLIDGVTVLPMSTRRLLIAAERSGDLTQTFELLADDMAVELDRRSQRLIALLEPFMIVVLFAVIASLVLALMLPMIKLAGGVA
jgi:type II secretory pathway component PulF